MFFSFSALVEITLCLQTILWYWMIEEENSLDVFSRHFEVVAVTGLTAGGIKMLVVCKIKRKKGKSKDYMMTKYS